MRIDKITNNTQIFIVNHDRVGGFVLAHLDAEDGYTMVRDDLTPDEKREVCHMLMDWGWTV